MTGATSVTFGGTAASSFTVNSNTQITAVTPAGTAGAVSVAVQTAGGTGTLSGGYTYVAPPTITSVSPNQGSTSGGTTVIISGTNLTGATSVTFGVTAASSFTVNSNTQITAVTPPRAAGTVSVVVATVYGQTALPGGYTYVAPPTANSQSVTTAYQTAKAITLSGSNATTYTVNTAPSHGSLSGTAPNLTYTPTGGYSGADSFTFYTSNGAGNSAPATVSITVQQQPPTLTGVSPQQGPTSGGTTVTLSGSGFTGTTAVTFSGTAAASFTVNTDSQITAVTPAHAAGAVNVSVQNGAGVAVYGSAFTYVAPPTANGQSVTTPYNTAASITLSGSNATTYIVNTVPSHGSLSGTAPNLTYTPTTGYSGADSFTFYTSNGAGNSAPATVSITVGGPTITLTPTAVPNGRVGVAYSQALTASGGATPYTFVVTAGALPAGLNLSTTGLLSGTPTAGGGFNFTVTATDANGFTGSQAYSPTINGAIIPVAPPTLPNGAVGTPYNQTVSASGGTAPYTFAITAGALPAGLTLSSAGAISGTPTGGGTVNFTVTATDHSTGSGPYTGSRAYTVTFAPPTITVAPATLPNGTVAAPYSQTVTASGGTGSYTFAITAGALPAGLTLSSTGTISGTSTAGGTANFTVTATDSSSGSGPYGGSRAYSLNIAAPTITVAPATLPGGTVAAPYSQTVTASGGTGSYTFAITAGALPAGITLTSTGTISGTPTAGGSFTFSVTATDRSTGTGPYSGTRAYTLNIAAPTIAVAPASLPNAAAGMAYSQALTASGGTAPYTFALTSGSLPSGITLASNGVLSGTSTVAGTFNFTVAATDASTGSGPYTGNKSYSLTVGAPTVTVAPATLPSGTVGTAYSQTVTASGGTAPYTYAITAGALPAGLNLATGGTISGTPTAGGSFTFTVTATDANGFTGARSYTLTMAASTLSVAPATLPNGTAGAAYSQTVTASGGTAPYSFAITAGALPAGLTLSSTGTIGGTPTVGGTANFTVTATDSSSGSGPYGGSRAYAVTFAPGAAGTVLTSSANPSVQGQAVTFTATVTGQSPTGTVTFKDGATAIGTAALSGGTASFATTALTVGSHAVTAVYGGDASNVASTSAVLTQAVTPATAATTTVLAATPNPAAVGQAVTLTATVTAASGTPTGSVTFTGNGTTLGTATLSGGVATLTTTALPIGTDTLVATYGGATGFGTSSGSTTETIAAGSTVTALAATPNPSAFGKPVTFTATVTGQSPTGTVTFKDGGASIGTATLSGGTATLSTAALAAGAHAITAAYAGDTANAASVSPALAQQVNTATTATRLTASQNPIMAGQSVRLTAAVTVVSNTASRGAQAAAAPSGSVTFRANGAVLGTAALAGGSASFVTTALAVGAESITAVYAGDGSFATSVSPALTVQVDPAAGALTLTVTATGRDGSFGFTSTLPGAGAFTLGTVSGKAQRSFTALPPGTYALTAGSLPPGFAAQGLACSTGSTAGSTATVTVAAGATVTCTFAANFDAAAIQKATQAAIRDFLQQRAEVISNADPDTRRMHERLTGSVFGGEDEDRTAGAYGKMPVEVTGGSTLGSNDVHASTSLAQMLQPMDKLRFDIWSDVRFGSYRDTPNTGLVGLTPNHYDGRSTIAFTGVDYRVLPGMLVGLLTEYDQVSQQSSTLGTQADGRGYMVGPYTSIALTRNLFLDARAGFGQSVNSIVPQGLLRDRFDTDRQLYRAELSGRFGWQGLEIDPSIAALYFQEHQRAFTDAFGLRIGGQTVSLGQMAVGPDFAYPLALDGALVTPRFGIKAVYDFQRDDAAALALGVGQPTAALRARMEGGLDIDNVFGFGLGSSISYDGLGDRSFSAISGRFTAKKSFDVRPEGIFATQH